MHVSGNVQINLSEVQANDGATQNLYTEYFRSNEIQPLTIKTVQTTESDLIYTPPDDVDFLIAEDQDIDVTDWDTNSSVMSSIIQSP